MDALQPTFMLPPNFRFPPDGKIKPGIMLKEGDKGLPDPQEEMFNGTAQVTGLETLELPQFHYSGGAKFNNRLGPWADVLSLAEIGLSGERGHDDNLVIDTAAVKISTFSPTEAYILRLMKDPSLEEYTVLPRRRAVYLITGVMVMDSATIEVQRGTASAYQAKIVIKGDGFGVPVKVGPEFEREASDVGGHTWEMTKPFVLAYALKKIRRKMLGGVGSGDYVKIVIFDCAPPMTYDDWDVEDVTEELVSSTRRVV